MQLSEQFILAIRTHQTSEAISLLEQGTDPNTLDRGTPVICISIQQSNVEITKELLLFGATILDPISNESDHKPYSTSSRIAIECLQSFLTTSLGHLGLFNCLLWINSIGTTYNLMVYAVLAYLL
jgi:hypothetical protein